ncbi:MAG: DNA repair protein RadC [Bacteroidetes bacterium]|nr:DNA repair protein RadC [Bacteroidota bacterium]
MDNQTSSINWEMRETSAYKVLNRGNLAVSDLEILAAFVKDLDVAKELLMTFRSLRNLAAANMRELMEVRGMTKNAALRIVGCFELARRKNEEDKDSVQINSSRKVAEYIKSKYSDHLQEIFTVIFLNRNNEIIAEEQLFTGGVSATIIDPRIVFRKAVQYLASSIILAHNHPSGNLQPSSADKDITAKLRDAGKLLDINVLDHLIISYRGYFSFADEGVL